ncbi:hypothetical protein ACHQM5_020051 [Ranunculus cassubicifolius]
MSGYSCWSGDWDDKIYIGERRGISTKERPEMKWLWRITFIGFYNIRQGVLHKMVVVSQLKRFTRNLGSQTILVMA